MRIDQLTWVSAEGWEPGGEADQAVQLVLYFGNTDLLATDAWYPQLRARFPAAHMVGCSSGDQISDAGMLESGIVAIAVTFRETRLRLATGTVQGAAHSRSDGEAVGRQLAASDLAGVLVLSDGLNANGGELVRGLVSAVGTSVMIGGGLAGDGARFAETRVGADAPPRPAQIAAVGFYGQAIRFSYGSGRGWDTFGVPRRVTRSRGN
ncbi:MAG: FIST N-terminal domain-containing protein [Steroidobacteraceae bacterium]